MFCVTACCCIPISGLFITSQKPSYNTDDKIYYSRSKFSYWWCFGFISGGVPWERMVRVFLCYFADVDTFSNKWMKQLRRSLFSRLFAVYVTIQTYLWNVCILQGWVIGWLHVRRLCTCQIWFLVGLHHWNKILKRNFQFLWKAGRIFLLRPAQTQWYVKIFRGIVFDQ